MTVTTTGTAEIISTTTVRKQGEAIQALERERDKYKALAERLQSRGIESLHFDIEDLEKRLEILRGCVESADSGDETPYILVTDAAALALYGPGPCGEVVHRGEPVEDTPREQERHPADQGGRNE